MAESSGVKSKKKLKNNVDKIDDLLSALADAMKCQCESIQKMMNGNSGEPYWNGSKAKTYYKKVTGNLSHDVDDYITAYNNAQALANAVDSLNKYDKEN